jgi:DNA-binding transcriptional LysR family regulator
MPSRADSTRGPGPGAQGRRHRVDFDLRQLEIFCRVVEHGSISRAAEAVHLTQSSVSERMANFERAIGVKLLDRVGLKRGRIAIGGSTIPGEYILPGVIRRFHEQHPQILVQLRIQDTDEIAHAVADGQLSLAVIGSKTTVKGLHYTELWQDELVVAVPPGHAWARRRSVEAKELLSVPFLLREAGSGTRRLLEQHLAAEHGGQLDGAEGGRDGRDRRGRDLRARRVRRSAGQAAERRAHQGAAPQPLVLPDPRHAPHAVAAGARLPRFPAGGRRGRTAGRRGSPISGGGDYRQYLFDISAQLLYPLRLASAR